MGNLSASQIKAAKPQEREYRLNDGAGLNLIVRTNGAKSWRYRYSRDGKDAQITLGSWPGLSLLEAREQALMLSKGRQQGEDPVLQTKRKAIKRRAAASDCFADIAEAYMQREEAGWSRSHAERFSNRMERDVIPAIGDMHASEIQPADVMRAIAAIEARGSRNTANRVVGMISQVLQFAVARGFASQDVTLHMRKGLEKSPRAQHRAAVTERIELGHLLHDIWTSPGNTIAKPLIQICALTFQRPGEVRQMRWQDVDLEKGLWAARVTKVDIDHITPLSRQVVEILKPLHRLAANRDHVFCTQGRIDKPVSDVLPMKFLRKIGWADRQTAHGFRAIARTLIAEDLKIDPMLIERQLSHTVRSAHGRAYDRTAYLDERAGMMQAYADLLDRLRLDAASVRRTA